MNLNTHGNAATKNIVLTASTEEEICGQVDVLPVLFTGVGKVNAAIALTRFFEVYKRENGGLPELVINYGTAGSPKFKENELVDCTRFFQRDMDVSSLGFQKGETPFDEGYVTLRFANTAYNPIGRHALCCTGDSFVANTLQESYDVVDMEAYALAKVCTIYGVRFIAFKYIVPEVGHETHQAWQLELKSGMELFSKLILDHYSSTHG